MHADSIADMLTRIRNAMARNADSVEVPYTKINEQVAKVLVENEFLKSVKPYKVKDKSFKGLNIELKYSESEEPAIKSINRISKSSLRKYIGYRSLKPVMGNLGIEVISTPRGVMSTKEAKKKKLGGELICRVY